MKRHRHTALPAKKNKFHSILFFLPLFLSVFGLIFVFEASSIRSLNEYGNSYHYLQYQAVWITLGIIAMTVFSFFDYKRLYTLAFPFMIITIVLLLAVLIPQI